MLSSHVQGFLIARGYVATSAKQRRSILRQFISAVGDPEPHELTIAMAFMWWASIAHLSPSSRCAHLSAVRQFIAHLTVLQLLAIDPTAAIQRPRTSARPPVTLKASQVATFIAYLPTVRDRAIAALMLGCGLRASDVAALDVEDVDLDTQVLAVKGKGGKTRLAPMPVAAIECVGDLLRIHPATTGPLIRSRCGGRLTSHTLRLILTRHLYDTGIKQCAHDGRSSHVLRRTCATMLLESGVSIRDVQTVMGHESIATTQAYLALPDTRKLVSIIERGPLAHMRDRMPQAS